eukprot:TRINITY_DN19151_c0_g2_i1.p1 TRINITY_DN19151_c0_g2~~TRINITY_DN19151_c0_g2_i1.p1  ORF type:complete len:774 (+),score=322.80 TRINITY_DN19151_c0_g2_i1:66-2324(+)
MATTPGGHDILAPGEPGGPAAKPKLLRRKTKGRRSRSRGPPRAHPAPGGVRRMGGDAASTVSSSSAATTTTLSSGAGAVPLITPHDINALQVICNPDKKWTLPINVDHINLTWVFRRKGGVGADANGEGWGGYAASSPAKSCATPETRSTPGSPTSPAATFSATSTTPDADGGVVVERGGSGGAASPSVAGSSAARRPFRTLAAFNEDYLIECRKSGTAPARSDALITSPRSALIILRSGLTVRQLCRLPKETLIAETSLEGVSKRVEKSREQHIETRRAAQLASLKKMYDVACSTISREQLADMVWESGQTPKSRALNTVTTVYQQSQHGGGGSVASPQTQHSASKDELRSQRLIKEKHLGIPTAPLVYDTDLQLAVGQIRARSVTKATRELLLRKKQMEMAVAGEKRTYERDTKAMQELENTKREKEAKAVEHVETVRKHTEELRRRALAVKDEEENRRQRTIERLALKEKQTEDRLEAERRLRAEKQARHREMIDARRKNAKRQSFLNNQNHVDSALAKQREMDEQHERDSALREARRDVQKADRQRRNEERSQKARANAVMMQEQFRMVMKMKEEKAEQQISEFRRTQHDFLEAKKRNHLLKDIRGVKIRNQAEGRFDDWMESILDRAREASEEAQKAAETRHQRLEAVRENERQKANDRRLEKERLGNVQQYRNIALLETQVQKHHFLENQKEQRAAASLQARSIQDHTRVARQTALETLEAQELQARKERAYLLQNNLHPKFEAAL